MFPCMRSKVMGFARAQPILRAEIPKLGAVARMEPTGRRKAPPDGAIRDSTRAAKIPQFASLRPGYDARRHFGDLPVGQGGHELSRGHLIKVLAGTPRSPQAPPSGPVQQPANGPAPARTATCARPKSSECAQLGDMPRLSAQTHR